MLNFHFNVVNVAGGDGRQFTALGDGKLLKLLATWGPVVAGLFGLKLPALPDFTSGVAESAVDNGAQS